MMETVASYDERVALASEFIHEELLPKFQSDFTKVTTEMIQNRLIHLSVDEFNARMKKIKVEIYTRPSEKDYLYKITMKSNEPFPAGFANHFDLIGLNITGEQATDILKRDEAITEGLAQQMVSGADITNVDLFKNIDESIYQEERKILKQLVTSLCLDQKLLLEVF